MWHEVLGHSGDVDQALASLSARYDAGSDVHERALLNAELQLEAERNPEFRPVYEAYLDAVYAEMRELFITLFKRLGKQVSGNLDAVLVTTRLLGLGLGAPSTLGRAIAARETPGRIMFEFLSGVIAAAPPAEMPVGDD